MPGNLGGREWQAVPTDPLDSMLCDSQTATRYIQAEPHLKGKLLNTSARV